MNISWHSSVKTSMVFEARLRLSLPIWRNDVLFSTAVPDSLRYELIHFSGQVTVRETSFAQPHLSPWD